MIRLNLPSLGPPPHTTEPCSDCECCGYPRADERRVIAKALRMLGEEYYRHADSAKFPLDRTINLTREGLLNALADEIDPDTKEKP